MKNSEFRRIFNAITFWNEKSEQEFQKLFGYACHEYDMDLSCPADRNTVASLILSHGYLFEIEKSVGVLLDNFTAETRPYIMDTEKWGDDDDDEVFYTRKEYEKSYNELKAMGETEAETFEDYVENSLCKNGGTMGFI